jgi:tetratricopeptide (TPR) repeat protein
MMAESADEYFFFGNQQRKLGNIDQAMHAYRMCLQARPDFAEAHNNLGVLLAQCRRNEEAAIHFAQAIRLRPGYIDAEFNRARCLRESGELALAIPLLQELVPKYPSHVNLLVELGCTYQAAGEVQRAIDALESACDLAPHLPEAHWNLGIAYLTAGNFERGWEEYEWRWKSAEFQAYSPAYGRLQWTGQDLSGTRILVHVEQGIGDAIQFVRFTRALQAKGAKVWLHLPGKLKRLLVHCGGVDGCVSIGQPWPEVDWEVSMLSLPRLLGMDLTSFPNASYLRSEPEVRQRWADYFATMPGFRIGIVWQGNPRNPLDHLRSIPLTAFEPLAKLQGVRLFSLQKGPGSEQLPLLAERLAVHDLGSISDLGEDALIDAAGILDNLDLLIACDTALAHLAGAMGRPAWLAIPHVGDWRWMLHRADSPWYPSMRLFRRFPGQSWRDVLERMAGQLPELLSKG